MEYQKLYDVVMPRLEQELPEWLTYHNAGHTKYVIASAELLGKAENLEEADLALLRTAALLHDAGFLQQAHGHEEISCIMAREMLPEFGYDIHQVEKICRAIMATQVPQSPTDKLGEILCDADLYYILEKNYAVTADNLYNELRHRGEIQSDEEWQLRQIEFLSNQRFFTSTANNRLEGKKEAILKQLNATLEKTISARSLKESGWLQDLLLTVFGAAIAAVALKLFMVPNHFFDGGITGMALLVHEIYGYSLGNAIVVLNLPLIAVGYFTIGKRFAIRTTLAVVLLAVALMLIPLYQVTADKLLICIFGGAFLGIGVGLIMCTGAALDGIEVLAVYTLKRTSFTITEIILGINIIIFAIAAFRFGIETAMYSVITYFTATRCIDYVVEGLQAFTGVTIVSSKSEAVKYQVVNKMGKGITVYKGERGFLPGKFEVSSECDIIFTVITRLEMRKLKNLVYDVDPNAFVFAGTIKEASGGILARKHHH